MTRVQGGGWLLLENGGSVLSVLSRSRGIGSWDFLDVVGRVLGGYLRVRLGLLVVCEFGTALMLYAMDE